jgi:phosphatidylglycerophosphatase A
MLIATAGPAGFFPRAPGTMGSLVGVLICIGISMFELQLFHLPLVAGLAGLGTWAAGRSEVAYGHDASRIVIDEVVGQMLALALVVRSNGSTLAVGTILGFLLFRFFDILKPFPIRRFENLPGGVGVMADDLGAGVYAFLALLVLEPLVVDMVLG